MENFFPYTTLFRLPGLREMTKKKSPRVPARREAYNNLEPVRVRKAERPPAATRAKLARSEEIANANAFAKNQKTKIEDFGAPGRTVLAAARLVHLRAFGAPIPNSVRASDRNSHQPDRKSTRLNSSH